MEQSQHTLSLIVSDPERSQKIRVVVSDMDGSFLNGAGKVSKANREAVKRLQEAGLRFIVCTGRTFGEASLPLKEAGIACDMIAMNGAAIYGKDGKLKREHFLSMNKVRAVFQAVRDWQKELILQLVTDQGEYIVAEEEVFRHFFLTRLFPGKDRTREEEDLILKPYRRIVPEAFFRMELKCYKAVTLSEDVDLIRQIEGRLKQIPEVCVAASFSTNWEITDKYASKGEGLTDYIQSLGCSLNQVMAFGDGDNDRTMLSLPLGWSVAMGNASEGLKKAADMITLSNEEDGFAEAADALLEANRRRREQ